MNSAAAVPGARNFDVRRPRLQPGLSPDERQDESLPHKRASPKRSILSKECKEFAGSEEDEDNFKHQNGKIFSRKIFPLLGLAVAAAVVTLAYDSSVYTSYIKRLDKPAQDFLEGAFSTLAERTVMEEGLIPGCVSISNSKLSLKARLFSSAFGTSFSDCYPPQGAPIVTWMRDEYPHHGLLKIGLVNIEGEDERKWEQFTRDWGKVHSFPFRSVSSLGLTWDNFYPSWIDEEGKMTGKAAKCPRLPLPSVSHGVTLDVVIAKVPGECSGSGWRRDIRRLQITLAAATVASQSQSVLIAIISKCRPPVNLFTCDELLEVQDGVWLFQVDFDQLRRRLAVPVGACELALPSSKMVANSSGMGQRMRSKISWVRVHREAYATILHSGGRYTCGAIVLGQSIRSTDSERDLIALVDASISSGQRRGLEKAGWKLYDIERIKNPKSDPKTYNAFNYSKFRLWQLTQYAKIVFIDADLLVLRNMDALFDLPQISATSNNRYIFNSGVMVIEPSNCTFDLFMRQINEVESYNGGDQGFLNEIFPWWHRIPKRMNYLKYFWSNVSSEGRKQEYAEKNGLFQADPPVLYALHFLGEKPWFCFRDYDCNWNTPFASQYASDTANARWWKAHDSMSKELQQYCLLPTERKAALERDRRDAKAANQKDQHWKINITDPRLRICIEQNCHWESMV